MTAACCFDKLFMKNVPHVLEKIFYSADYESFKNCLHVSKLWNDRLTSESLKLRCKVVFCENIQTDLLESAMSGLIHNITFVLSFSMADLNFVNIWHESPLILAAKHGHRDVVKLLINRGAVPDLTSYHGITPLRFAAEQGHRDVVELLLNRGQIQTSREGRGRTLHFCWLQKMDTMM